jgi:hypothetical protein
MCVPQGIALAARDCKYAEVMKAADGMLAARCNIGISARPTGQLAYQAIAASQRMKAASIVRSWPDPDGRVGVNHRRLIGHQPDLPFQRNAHLDQRAVRPSQPQSVPELVRCYETDQRVTDRLLRGLCDNPLAALGPPCVGWASYRARRDPIGTHGGPRYAIDLGAPVCPMEPEGGAP